MAANGISTLTYKHDRQEAKLARASVERRIAGDPSTLDIERLPTVYGPNDNSATAIIDNPNIGGLLPGRPWTTETFNVLFGTDNVVYLTDNVVY